MFKSVSQFESVILFILYVKQKKVVQEFSQMLSKRENSKKRGPFPSRYQEEDKIACNLHKVANCLNQYHKVALKWGPIFI